jgi:hypothetical protein
LAKNRDFGSIKTFQKVICNLRFLFLRGTPGGAGIIGLNKSINSGTEYFIIQNPG